MQDIFITVQHVVLCIGNNCCQVLKCIYLGRLEDFLRITVQTLWNVIFIWRKTKIGVYILTICDFYNQINFIKVCFCVVSCNKNLDWTKLYTISHDSVFTNLMINDFQLMRYCLSLNSSVLKAAWLRFTCNKTEVIYIPNVKIRWVFSALNFNLTIGKLTKCSTIEKIMPNGILLNTQTKHYNETLCKMISDLYFILYCNLHSRYSINLLNYFTL